MQPSFFKVTVAVPTPAYRAVGGSATGVVSGSLLDYSSQIPLQPGALVVVPMGRREVLGIVWNAPPDSSTLATPASDQRPLREITRVLTDITPLSALWRNLVSFASQYYQRSLGDVAHSALPPLLRSSATTMRKRRRSTSASARAIHNVGAFAQISPPDMTPAQQAACDLMLRSRGPFLLFGATGSGKTEVYMRVIEATLEASGSAQILVLVPEINLTPQLEHRLLQRFAAKYGGDVLTTIHSGLTPNQRQANWLAAHRGPTNGGARIILGTRTAVFASFSDLQLIVVDEEHDTSYKSQDRIRYSARDLAVYRGGAEHIRVILGSATPSLESWVNATRTPAGAKPPKYTLVRMPARIGNAPLPTTRMRPPPARSTGLLLNQDITTAIAARMAHDDQVLILLNRRGYAPVLGCAECAWKSECPNCSAHQVFHKRTQLLQCHHCGSSRRVPRHCPACGNLDLHAVGTGTEKIEEALIELAKGWVRSNGTPATVLRLDADSTRKRGALADALEQIHSGSAHIVVGTQMIAKGHDFRRISLVVVLNADAALYSADFRAPEHLFALLIQVAGRAGRDAAMATPSELWIQTAFPSHPVLLAVKNHDYERYAEVELRNRQTSGMPPFAFQALLRADARDQATAQAFLTAAVAAALEHAQDPAISGYAAVPLSMPRVARIERAQLLLESTSRKALHRFLAHCNRLLLDAGTQRQDSPVLRWFIDVDPLEI